MNAGGFGSGGFGAGGFGASGFGQQPAFGPSSSSGSSFFPTSGGFGPSTTFGNTSVPSGFTGQPQFGFGVSSNNTGPSTFGVSSQPVAFGRGSAFGSAPPTQAGIGQGRGSGFGAVASFGGSSFAAPTTFGGPAVPNFKLNPNAPSFAPRGPPAAVSSFRKDPTNALFVKLPQGSAITEDQLLEYFSRFGTVKSLVLKPNGKCYIKMGSISEAQQVMAQSRHDYNLHVRWDTYANVSQPSDAVPDESAGAFGDEEEAMDTSKSAPTDLEEKQRRLDELKADIERKQRLKQARSKQTERKTSFEEEPSKNPNEQFRFPASSTGAATRSRAVSPETSTKDGFVVGTCTLMCPESETAVRISANQIDLLEQPHPELPELGSDPFKLTVMKFQRSAATGHMDIPELIRTPEALDMTCDYLWKNILDIDTKGPDPRYRDSALPGISDRPSLSNVNNFIMDRIKRVIQELGLQGFTKEGGPVEVKIVRLLEECARCEILLYQEMSDAKVEDWSERLANEALNSTLKALLETYSKIHDKLPDTRLLNEPEMQAYYMLLQLGAKEESSTLIVQEIFLRWRAHSIVVLAKRAYDAFFAGNFTDFFQCMTHDAPWLLACLMRRGLDRTRQVALAHLNGSFEEGTQIAIDRFARILYLDSPQDAVEYCADSSQRLENGMVILNGQSGAISAMSTKLTRKYGCAALNRARLGIDRKYLVGDESRAWMPRDDLRLNRLRCVQSVSVVSKASSDVPPENRREPQEETIQRQKREMEAQEEERKRQFEVEARRVKELEEEEERERKRQREQEEERERRRRDEEEKERQKERENKEKEERRKEIKRKNALSGALLLDKLTNKLASSRFQRSVLRQWKMTARHETDVLLDRFHRAERIAKRMLLRRSFEEWRFRAQLGKGMRLIDAISRKMFMRKMWRAFERVASSKLHLRRERFESSLLTPLDAFPNVSMDNFSTKSPLTRSFSFTSNSITTTDSELDRLIEQVESMLSPRTFSKLHPHQKIIVVSSDSCAPIARLFWTALGGDDTRFHVEFIFKEAINEHSAVGARAFLVADESLLEVVLKSLIPIAESCLEATSRVPVLVARRSTFGSPSKRARLDNQSDGERYLEVLDLVRLSSGPKAIAERVLSSLRDVLSISARLTSARVEEVNMRQFVLSHLPRLKWSPFSDVRDWIRQINLSLNEIQEILVNQVRECHWPTTLAGHADESSENFDENAILRTPMSQIEKTSNKLVEGGLPDDWNSLERLAAIEERLQSCLLRGDFTNRQIAEFATENQVTATFVDGLIVASHGDGLWMWEQMVCALIQSRIDVDWTAYVVERQALKDESKEESFSREQRRGDLLARIKEKTTLLGSLDEAPFQRRTNDHTGKHGVNVKPVGKRIWSTMEADRDADFEKILKKYLTEPVPLITDGSVSRALVVAPASDVVVFQESSIVERAKRERIRQEDLATRLEVLGLL